ncbi:MAG TPA: vitamin K epoxide reductase family protein [Candidatus Limnocylindrales bacterium]|nr:vitamin K epoxide reductase family protein [Candidatus Limnocylindrales bacterium]
MRWRSLALLCLAVVGLLISLDLAAFQVSLAGPPWDPLFGDGSRRVLTSDLSRLLPIPDAAVGAGAYLVEVILSAALVIRPSGLARTAIALAVVASIGAAVGAVLVGYQVLVVGAACTLCIASAVVSWVLAGGAIVEARERRLGRPSSTDDQGGDRGPRSPGSTEPSSKEPVAT